MNKKDGQKLFLVKFMKGKANGIPYLKKYGLFINKSQILKTKFI